MDSDFLQVNHIYKSFSGVNALQDVSISVSQGEILCLIGENGSGKSTLIKTIAGVLRPDSGEIILNGKCYKHLTPIESIREGIQVIYQDLSLFPNLTVAENIALNYQLSLKRKFVDWKEVKKVASAALSRIQVEMDLSTLVSQLPIAGKQLIAISRALLQNARLIIMDEPTSALTQKEVNSLFSVINGLKAEGISVLFVSHKLNEVNEISERVIILRNGQLVANEPASKISTTQMAYFISGKHIERKNYSFQSKGTERPLMRVSSLCLKGQYENVSFEVSSGEIVGITGLLGSGRNELALSLFGLLPADSGQIFFDGVETRINSIQDALKSGIGYVPEDRLTEGLFMERSIGENIQVRLIDQLYGLQTFLKRSQLNRVSTEWINDLQIKTNNSSLPAKSLSGGNQQRVVLAKWLASKPRILILNGPTVGVDVGSKAELHEIMRNLARQGTALLVLSDDIPELLQICNRILIMRKGRLLHQFNSSDIDEEILLSNINDSNPL